MTGPAPSFSVVVPTKGRPGYLRNCLAALSRLEHPRDGFEVVVANNGGGRAVERVVGEFGTRFPLSLVTTEYPGPSGPRNAGAARARGRFIAFTDDDCEPEQGWLRALERALEANPGAAVGGRTLNGAGGRCAAASQAAVDAVHAHFNSDGAPRFFASNNLAFEAAGFHAVGGFDEGLRYAEDRELCERWIRSGRRFAHAPDAVVRHMRELTPAEFWRQHFGYGRGAWSFHAARARRGWGRFAIEPGFYAALAREVRRHREHRPSLALLALVSQIANAVGFAREALARTHAANAPGRAPATRSSR